MESLSRRSLLEEIRHEALTVVENDPNICNRLSYPGHHPGIYDFSKSNGPMLQTTDGREVKDETHFWMTSPFNTDEFFKNDHDLKEEIGRLALSAPTTSEFGDPFLGLLLAKLKKEWPDMDKALTYTPGTLAVDAAAKWAEAIVQIENGYTPRDMRGVSAINAFHGRAGFPAEMTRESNKTKDWQTGWALRIPDPIVIFDEMGNVMEKETQNQVDESLGKLDKIFEKNPAAGFVALEYPFMAEGGALLVDDSALDGARSICDKYGRVFIIDCVQMAGRGWYLPEKAKDTADVIVVGKLFRSPATLLTDPTKRGFVDHADIPGNYGGTWAGLASQILSAVSIFKAIDENNLFENGIKMTDYLYDEIRWMTKAGLGPLRPRKAGTYLGLDFESKETRQKVIDKMWNDHSTLLLSAGETAIRMSPQLDATQEYMDELLSDFESSLRAL